MGCSVRKEDQVEVKKEIENIIVEFHPAFDEPSIAFFDLTNNRVVFKRLGAKTFYRFKDLPSSANSIPEILEKSAIESISYSLILSDYSFLKDSIQFTDEDFIDMEFGAHDGIFVSIIYVFNDGSIEDIDLSNSRTKNHNKLIDILINGAISSQPKDSLTKEYFYELKSYF